MYHFFNLILSHKYWVLGAAFVVCVWSAWGISRLNISAVPDVTNKQVMINTKTGAFSTEQIEKIVSYPIETELSGLPGVVELRSLSKYGLSQVIVVFEDDVDIYFARQLVSEKLQVVRGLLPEGLSPELGPMSTGLGEIFMWVLEYRESGQQPPLSSKEQLQYLHRVQEYLIRPRLKRVPGVAEIDTNGGFNTEVHINYTPSKLRRYGLNTTEVIQAITDAGTSFGGSYIKELGEQIIVRSLVHINDLAAIENIAIKRMPNGKTIYVKDICSVRFDSALRVGGATSNGRETVLGTVLMRVGANSREVAKNANEVLQSLQLPQNVRAQVVYNREFLVDKTISTVIKNLAEGAFLVGIVLLLILGNLKASIIVSLAIPLSMLVAIRGMQLFGISANLMSLGAIDFGLLVDASVVLVENFLRRSGQQGPNLSFAEKGHLLAQSCAEVAKPVIFGLAIIMLVYVPILSLEGVEGKMFEPMALTVLMALAMSLLVALFITPILLFLSFNRQVRENHPLLFKWIRKSYEPVLDLALRFPKLTLACGGLVFVTSVFVFLQLGVDFVPQLDEGDMVIGLVRDSRQHIEQSIKDQEDAEKIILSFSEVERVFSRIGTPESATDPMSPNFADTFVVLKKDQRDWPLVDGQRRTKAELFSAIKSKLLDKNPKQDISLTQPIEMRFNEILEGSRADITLRFLGPDLDKLMEYATRAEALLKDITGVQSIEFDALTGLTKSRVLDIEVNTEQAINYGLKPFAVNDYIRKSMAGTEVGTFFLEGRQIPFLFHLDESERDDIDSLKGLPVPLDGGGTVELGKLTNFRLEDRVTTIARRWAERYSAVSIYVGGRDIASIVREAQLKLAANLPLNDGYSIEWGGQFKNLERARAKLLIIVPLTLLLIFLLIFAMTKSVLQSVIIFSAIPMGVAGGVFLLSLRSMNFSVSAAIGFIALSGIVVLNSMVLVNFINQLTTDGSESREAIRQGALSRLRPVVMTALVAGLGFLPMAFNTGMGAEVQRPLATVVIGGLLTSTLLTMLVVPVLLTFISLGRKVS